MWGGLCFYCRLELLGGLLLLKGCFLCYSFCRRVVVGCFLLVLVLSDLVGCGADFVAALGFFFSCCCSLI